MEKSNWKTLIEKEMSRRGESLKDALHSTLNESEMTREFNVGYGGTTEGKPFTLWTASRVYFPAHYDGQEWCASVSRHPDGEPTKHIGGG